MNAPDQPWDPALAAAWDPWFHIVEGGAGVLSERMVELAGLGPGQRVLDIATGVGEPALTAARRVGPGGSVLATDLSPDMVGFGRRRAEEAGLSNVTFKEMNAAALDVPEAAFDAVLCRWGLMFLEDLPGALSAIRCCLAPGGVFVTSIWGAAEGAPAVGLSNRVIRAHLGLAPPDEGPGSPFALQDVDGFRCLVEAAGFTEVVGEWFTVEMAFQSLEEFIAFRRDRAGKLMEELGDVPEERMAGAWQAVADAVRRFERPDGSIVMPNEAYLVSGRRDA